MTFLAQQPFCLLALLVSSVLLSGCGDPPHFEGQYVGSLGDQCMPGSGLPAALDMHLDIRVDDPERRNPSYVARLRSNAFGEFPVSAPGKLDGDQLVFEFDKDEVRGWTGYQPQLLVVMTLEPHAGKEGHLWMSAFSLTALDARTESAAIETVTLEDLTEQAPFGTLGNNGLCLAPAS
ncbi:hypothetical protein [Alloalcanivorax xenomutans]|uniref:hypothetical protein n=1 Tax=Alloalcanivorax xenomutans TaxID=1094342 RepID=UPI001F46E5E3|nr:hypothetical protein [Alloalcanivorax xenomutans]MCE7525789.1 hypothetical protein [Alloalcanivorax xenomutans]